MKHHDSTCPIRLGVLVTALLVGLLINVVCRAEQDSSLVAHYSFDEGPGGAIKDHSGNGNHGKNLGAKYVKLLDGKGYALRFDTPEAYVDCGNTPSLDLTEALTLELWFYPEAALSKGEAGVIGKIMGSYCMSYSGNIWFYAPASAGFARSKPFSLDWHHLVATFDGKFVKVYCDGQLQSAVKASVETLPHGENFYLRYPATYLPPVEPPLTCTMDDVRVYSRALSDDEVASRYRQSAKASGRHDVTRFEQPGLTLHRFPQSSTLVTQIDYGDMAGISAGAKLLIEVLRDDKVVSEHEGLLAVVDHSGDDEDRRAEFTAAPMQGIVDWPTNVANLPAGDYVVRATIVNASGARIGVASSTDLRLPMQKPQWIKAYDGVKVLNNFVAELLNVQAPRQHATATYGFTNPRAGWVFVASTATPVGQDSVSVLVLIDGQQVIEHLKGTGQTIEAMRHLPAGEHRLTVRCSGKARPTRLIVRAIPEMQIAGLGYRPAPRMPPFGHYNAAYLQSIGLLDNLNVIIERSALPEDAEHVAAWLAAGKKRFTRFGMWPIWQTQGLTAEQVFEAWTENRGLKDAGYHGIIVDEFSGIGHGGIGKYPLYTQAINRIAADARFDDRDFYPYCMPMHPGQPAMDMLAAVIQRGDKWAEEEYLQEQPTEEAAREHINLRYVRNTLRYEESIPGAARHMVMVPGYLSAPPESLNSDPSVDFKVYMDMQMHALANNPVLFGLYGIQWYHLAYADEEHLRFTAKLFRHYGIEGRTDRLIDDPYMLPHVDNPDFVDGTTGWTLAPGQPDAISTAYVPGFGMLQTRIQSNPQRIGNNVLLTKRSAKAPNRFSQTIKQLTPGRTYSIKMFTADYHELLQGKSTDAAHHVNIQIENVELIPARSFHQIFRSGQAGHAYPPFDRQNNMYITYHRVVFRAKGTTAELSISDWKSDTEPGGPIGRTLMHNFIEVQPYLDD